MACVKLLVKASPPSLPGGGGNTNEPNSRSSLRLFRRASFPSTGVACPHARTAGIGPHGELHAMHVGPQV